MKKIQYCALVVLLAATSCIGLEVQKSVSMHDALRPPHTDGNRFRAMPQEEVEAVVLQLFTMVREDFGITGVSTPPPKRTITFYARQLREDRMSAQETYDYFVREAAWERQILAQPQPISEAQMALIREIEGALAHFLSFYGLQSPFVRVAAVPQEALGTGVFASYCPFHAVEAIPAGYEDEEILLPIGIHERLHSTAAGFAPTRLNEGMADYITTMLLMGRAGIESSSAQAIWNFYYQAIGGNFKAQGLNAPGYPVDLSAILVIINYIADDEHIIYAYLTGDTRPLEAALGPGVWQRIEEWAFQFEDVSAGRSRNAAEAETLVSELKRYFEGIRAILDEAAHNVPDAQEPTEPAEDDA